MANKHYQITEPSPYELYIRLHPLAASWPDGENNWQDSVVACCGFQAAELCLRLIEDALQDVRKYAFPQQRITRFVEHLIDGLDLTCSLLQNSNLPKSAVAIHACSAPSPGFSVVSKLDRTTVNQITSRFALASSGLTFQIGIEEQLREARRQQGLDIPEIGFTASVMDYLAIVSPHSVFNLREPEPCGPEDHLFSTAHQITECWLHIAHYYLNTARALADQNQWEAATQALRKACNTLPIAIQAGQLLDQMVLTDYHPLRVRLRDGSGAQSRAARQLSTAVRAAAQPLWNTLNSQGLELLDILEQPTMHLGVYQFLNALKAIGKQIQSFLFHHYLLALGVLGTHSLGSLGYEIRQLAERAAQPVFPEFNQAHHDYVMLTNFQYGESSGSIVFHNEITYGWNPYYPSLQSTECSPEIIKERIAAYFRCIEERDVDGWVNLFDPIQGQLHDVPGTRPYLGKARLKVFIEAMFNSFRQMYGTYSSPHINANRATVDWHFDAVSYHGCKTSFDGQEEFVFGENGQILKAIAQWNPSHVAQQWKLRMGKSKSQQ